VREALSWLGTKFHDHTGVKGAGTDCMFLLLRVFSTVGLIEAFEPDQYSPQWFQHRDEPRFLKGVMKYAHRVEVAGPGDVAMFNFGRHAAHGAIIIDNESMVHAYKPAGSVILDSRRVHAPRLDSLWSVFP
jgi:cell wall-associated NlpC family hydrolase